MIIKVYTFVKIFCCINLGVIGADLFRKYLGVKNDQPIRTEREVIAIIMKIFSKENMIMQYQISGLPYFVELRIVAHKLVIEIDEDGHPYYENDEIKQKLTKNLAFTFNKINPDPDSDAGCDPDVISIQLH